MIGAVVKAARMISSEIVDAELRAINDALQRTDGNYLAAVVCDDHLATVRMSPFLVTALLPTFTKPLRLKTRMTSFALQMG